MRNGFGCGRDSGRKWCWWGVTTDGDGRQSSGCSEPRIMRERNQRFSVEKMGGTGRSGFSYATKAKTVSAVESGDLAV